MPFYRITQRTTGSLPGNTSEFHEQHQLGAKPTRPLIVCCKEGAEGAKAAHNWLHAKYLLGFEMTSAQMDRLAALGVV